MTQAERNKARSTYKSQEVKRKAKVKADIAKVTAEEKAAKAKLVKELRKAQAKLREIERVERKLENQVDSIERKARFKRHRLRNSSGDLDAPDFPTEREVQSYNKKKLPSRGAFTAWKKARCAKSDAVVIIELAVPATAKRCTPFTSQGKSRVSEAKVVSIKLKDTGVDVSRAYSMHNNSFFYRKGATVTPDKYVHSTGTDYCTNGIHCFLNRKDAENY